ncbi:MAG: ABC transporter permease [Chloroflexi bacterium]|nr:ABC transporter permease [Chloroflexota bacterium]MCI0815148.1 ABC transporter permease [Chloroflexota bacterium]MCI0818164.1 ABC transporter permease [Chloroflexota bacterium]MCI0819835.1 ABC transporter permease [Chloroflexota bacterium]MCI0832019.1 ABC transporter permease [Chloroflexota bacterium]
MTEADIVLQESTEDLFSGREHRGLWADAFRRLIRNRLALVALIVLGVIIVLTLLGNYVDVVGRYTPREQNYDAIHESPSLQHFFGTDQLGRDTWSRVLQGILISLQVGIGVQVVALSIGLLVGGIAAIGGRALDNLMMRITDLAYAFPDLLFIILLREALRGKDWPIIEEPVVQIIVAISFVAWVTIARLVRAQMLSLKEMDFVLAAEAMGATRTRIVFTHMLPNTLGPVIVAVIFGIPLAIFAEAVLGFIGIGVPVPIASLGVLVADGNAFVRINVWMVIFPAAAIGLLMLCFTFLGDGLRDALDPRSR